MESIGLDSKILIAQIANIVLLLALIGFIWLIIRFLRNTKRDPLDIARTRYAKGKITLEEFERIKKTITEES